MIKRSPCLAKLAQFPLNAATAETELAALGHGSHSSRYKTVCAALTFRERRFKLLRFALPEGWLAAQM